MAKGVKTGMKEEAGDETLPDDETKESVETRERARRVRWEAPEDEGREIPPDEAGSERRGRKIKAGHGAGEHHRAGCVARPGRQRKERR